MTAIPCHPPAVSDMATIALLGGEASAYGVAKSLAAGASTVDVAKALTDAGIKVCFGIPGVQNLKLYEGLAESGCQNLLVANEESAARAEGAEPKGMLTVTAAAKVTRSFEGHQGSLVIVTFQYQMRNCNLH